MPAAGRVAFAAIAADGQSDPKLPGTGMEIAEFQADRLYVAIPMRKGAIRTGRFAFCLTFAPRGNAGGHSAVQ
jgi:hypothetical protein